MSERVNCSNELYDGVIIKPTPAVDNDKVMVILYSVTYLEI